MLAEKNVVGSISPTGASLPHVICIKWLLQFSALTAA